MSNVIQDLERAQLRNVPRFKAGDTVRVHFQVIEGTRRRVQVFEGIVLKRQGAGARETFTVRKQSFGIGVERTAGGRDDPAGGLRRGGAHVPAALAARAHPAGRDRAHGLERRRRELASECCALARWDKELRTRETRSPVCSVQ